VPVRSPAIDIILKYQFFYDGIILVTKLLMPKYTERHALAKLAKG